jgi:hypothetical protein
MQTVAYWLMLPFMLLAFIFETLSGKLMEGVERVMAWFEKGELSGS